MEQIHRWPYDHFLEVSEFLVDRFLAMYHDDDEEQENKREKIEEDECQQDRKEKQ